MKHTKSWMLLCAGVLCAAAISACGVNPPSSSSLGGEPGAVSEPAELMGQYETIENYAVPQEEEFQYISTSTNQLATAKVLDGMSVNLKQEAEVPDLAPNGVLEGWSFERRHMLDADDVLLVGARYREDDGWYNLEPGGHMVIALRYDDGSYDILYDELVTDIPEFFGDNDNWEDAIHDWYVTNYDT